MRRDAEPEKEEEKEEEEASTRSAMACHAANPSGAQGASSAGELLSRGQPSQQAAGRLQQAAGRQQPAQPEAHAARIAADPEQPMPRLDLSSLHSSAAAAPGEARSSQYPAAKKLLAWSGCEAALVAYPGDPREHPWAVRGALFHGSTGEPRSVYPRRDII